MSNSKKKINIVRNMQATHVCTVCDGLQTVPLTILVIQVSLWSTASFCLNCANPRWPKTSSPQDVCAELFCVHFQCHS